MVKCLKDYKEQGTVKDITPEEKEYYEKFLEENYKDNMVASEYLAIKHPRWSVISGYYAMHDVSKLYLAKQFNLKFSFPEIHAAVIQALRELVDNKKVLELISKAEEEYEEIINLHLTLRRGKDEREKTQYYKSIETNSKVPMQKSSYFIEKLVKPYIKLVEDLMK